MLILYTSGGSRPTVNWPALSLLTVRAWAVAVEVTVTVAPVITAPCGSVTVPRIAPVVDVWPKANCAVITGRSKANTTLRLQEEKEFHFMSEPLLFGFLHYARDFRFM
jgi:hypothetical protein